MLLFYLYPWCYQFCNNGIFFEANEIYRENFYFIFHFYFDDAKINQKGSDDKTILIIHTLDSIN